MVDTGLMRKMNLNILIEHLKKYNLNVKLVKASNLFIKKLKKVSDPEKKEKSLAIYLLKFLKKSRKNIKILNF